MTSTDDRELSPSASKVRDGQVKIDHAKALKNRVYGLVKQSKPDETIFRQAVRDMLKTMDEVKLDKTGSIEENSRSLLENQVKRAQVKALERLSVINPTISSIDQVVDLEGNPPRAGKFPLAKLTPGPEETQEIEGASGFETVTGHVTDERQVDGRSQPEAGSQPRGIEEPQAGPNQREDTTSEIGSARRMGATETKKVGPGRIEHELAGWEMRPANGRYDLEGLVEGRARSKTGRKGKKARARAAQFRRIEEAEDNPVPKREDPLEEEIRRRMEKRAQQL